MPTLLLLAACTEPVADPPASDPPPDLSAPGPWSAGTRVLEVPGTTGETLTIQLWYPTDAESGPIRYDGLLDGDAAVDAAPACDGAAPLLAFSHGSGGMRYQSPYLTERLATWGWVVVAPDHPGNTLFDVDPDYAALASARPRHVVDAIDAALADEDLAPCLGGVDTYAVAGHSFGGYTALALAGAECNTGGGGVASYADPRVTAAIGLAPWDGAGTITDGTRDVAVPTMILTGERDEITPIAQVRGLFDPLPGPDRWLGVFPDAGHYSFSPVACEVLAGDGCGPDFLPLDRLEALTNQAALAFLHAEVLGQDGAIDQLPPDGDELAFDR